MVMTEGWFIFTHVHVLQATLWENAMAALKAPAQSHLRKTAP
jgi:hypothetical protein